MRDLIISDRQSFIAMADTVDLMAFVMGGGRLLEAADQENRVDLSSWMDEHENVDSLLAKFSDSDPAAGARVSDSESGGGDDVGSPDVDVEGVDFGDGVVPETPDGSEDSDGSDDGDDGEESEICSCDSCAGDIDSDDSDISNITTLSDDVFLPAEDDDDDKKTVDDKDEKDVTVGAVSREVGDPSTYSDISDAEDEAGGSSVAGGDYSDISSDEDEREYLSPSNNDDGASPAGHGFDYPDTNGHIGNWLPTVYSASWVHEDPNDCAETDVNCPPPPEGSRAASVCMLANRPNYFGCVIRNFASDPDFGSDSDSEDDCDGVCEGGSGDVSSVCNVSVDSGLYSCDDDDLQTDYDGDSECDSPAVPAAAGAIEDDCVLVEVISDADSTPPSRVDEDGLDYDRDVIMELAETGMRRYVLHPVPVSVAPGFGANSKLVCAGLGAIGAAEKRLDQIRENDSGLRHILNVDSDRAANEKAGADGETQLELTGPMTMAYDATVRLGSEHHEYLNTQLILRQYAEKGVPAWFETMRVTLSASSGERYSISAPQSEWRDFYGYFGDFLDDPLQDLVCMMAPAPKNFGRAFDRAKYAKFIFIYASCDNVGGDVNLVRFLKCLDGGFMPLGDDTELTFLSHKPVVVVFREQDASYPKCLPTIQFVCHDTQPLLHDGVNPGDKCRGHMCACRVCAAAYTCSSHLEICIRRDKQILRVEPMRVKRKLDSDEEDEDLQAALMASIDPNAYRNLSTDNDSDSVIVRKTADGSFTYEDRQTTRHPRRRRRVCAEGRRRGRPIRYTRPVEPVVDADVIVETAPTAADDVCENVGARIEVPVTVHFDNTGENDLPDIDNVPAAPVVDKVSVAPKAPEVPEITESPEMPAAPEPPVVRARTLRLTTRRVLGPRK